MSEAEPSLPSLPVEQNKLVGSVHVLSTSTFLFRNITLDYSLDSEMRFCFRIRQCHLEGKVML